MPESVLTHTIPGCGGGPALFAVDAVCVVLRAAFGVGVAVCAGAEAAVEVAGAAAAGALGAGAALVVVEAGAVVLEDLVLAEESVAVSALAFFDFLADFESLVAAWSVAAVVVSAVLAFFDFLVDFESLVAALVGCGCCRVGRVRFLRLLGGLRVGGRRLIR